MNIKNIWAILFFFLLFFFFAHNVSAGDVVINEFLVDPDADQWVELYNKGEAPVNISGWFIDDSGGTQKFTIPNDTIINSGEFKFFESSYFNFNRITRDTAKLLNGASIEDSYSYDTGPGTNKSYGRDTDGIGNWVVFNSPTKGSSNNTSSPEPTATLAPVPTNTPTPASAPTASPTPKKTSTTTPTKTAAPTKTSTPTPTKTPVPTKASTATIASAPTSILGESISAVPKEPSGGKVPVQQGFAGERVNKLPALLVGIGVILVGACGILVFRNYRKSHKNDNPKL